jgi:hypothetical protein
MSIVYRGFYPESQRSESKEAACFGTVAEWLNATACKAVWETSLPVRIRSVPQWCGRNHLSCDHTPFILSIHLGFAVVMSFFHDSYPWVNIIAEKFDIIVLPW